MGDQIKIRSASVKDVQSLLKIYAPYVENTAITFEYEVPSIEEFAGRVRQVQKRYPFLVAEAGGDILGYAYAGAFKERAAYDWAVETTVYVKNGKKRQGVGGRLYQALEYILKMQGILNLNACIADAPKEDEYLTKDSVIFHQKLGYRPVGTFQKCGYKFGRWYDMVWMEKHLGKHAENPPKVKTFEEVKERLYKIGGIL